LFAVLARGALAVWLALVVLWPLQAEAAAAARLEARTHEVDTWAVTRVLPDGSEPADARSAWQRREDFQASPLPHANLGVHARAVWLHVPLQMAADAPPDWWAHIDYPLLHEVQVTLFDAEGREVQAATLGSRVEFSKRLQATRALSLRLHLQPGARYDLMLRVETPTAMIVPLRILQAEALTQRESREQMVQGMFAGLALCMLAYSLLHWVSLRQPMFLYYAATLLSGQLFSAAYFGTGAQYLWPDSAWLATHMSALSPLLMTAANAQFLRHILGLRSRVSRVAQALNAVSVLSLLGAAGFVAGQLDYRLVSQLAMAVAVLHIALAIPVALRHARRGDRGALYLMVGWAVFTACIAGLSALLRGALPESFWTQHLFQIGSALEMMSWLLVLGVRVEQQRMAADRAQREHEWLHTLAHTDSLTGLPNRRGLEAALGTSLRGPAAPRYTAVYLLDLDGFKPVNDQMGHEAGDELLRQVAQRLRAAVRGSDVVARLGGDEFVVVANSLTEAQLAERIGHKLLASFDAPFCVADELRRVGATIGYAVHPEDTAGSPDTATLLRRADAAMYRGKIEGKHCLRRARPSDAEATAPLDWVL
jgi:diguanylate cyclase